MTRLACAGLTKFRASESQRHWKKDLRYVDIREQPSHPITFDAPFYIVCEGSADAAFLNHLLLIRGLPDAKFFIREVEGISKLEKHLNALQGSTDRSKLSYLAVVVDADLAPEERFRDIQTALINSQF